MSNEERYWQNSSISGLMTLFTALSLSHSYFGGNDIKIWTGMREGGSLGVAKIIAENDIINDFHYTFGNEASRRYLTANEKF